MAKKSAGLFHNSGELRDASRHNAAMTQPEASKLPIGVFDSGVGGLTVIKALQAELPHEDLVYLGDTARLPYGTKSPASISRYAGQATAVLESRGIKLLIVACNTASAVALAALERQLRPLPVIGVVEPGAIAATAVRRGGRHLVMATEATVRLGAYRDAILGLDAGASVKEIACEMMVALAEEGWSHGDLAEGIVRRYLQPVLDSGYRPDCLILGCTHFPLLHQAIRAVIGDDTAIVDSASTTAGVARELLEQRALGNPQQAAGTLGLLATDGATRFARVGGHFLGADLATADIELVDL